MDKREIFKLFVNQYAVWVAVKPLEDPGWSSRVDTCIAESEISFKYNNYIYISYFTSEFKTVQILYSSLSISLEEGWGD